METVKIPKRVLGSYEDYKNGDIRYKEFYFVLNHRVQSSSYKRNDGKGEDILFPPSFRLTLVDQIYCEEKKKMRQIRYIPGELSIYKDEQTPDNEVPKQNYVLEFVNGEKVVSGTDTLLLQYLFLTDKNGTKKDRDIKSNIRFYLVDPGQGLKTVMQNDETMFEAQHFCYKGEWDEVAAYAMVLGLPLDRDPSEVRYALRMRAQADPVKFMNGLKNPKMKRKYLVLEAIKMGVIEKNIVQNTIQWKGGGTIALAPIGKDPVDEFVDATFTLQGEKTWQTVVGIMRPELNEEVKPELTSQPSAELLEKIEKAKQENPEALSVNDISFSEIQALVKKGLEKEIITKKGGGYFVLDGDKTQGEVAFMKKLKGDKILLGYLKQKIAESEQA